MGENCPSSEVLFTMASIIATGSRISSDSPTTVGFSSRICLKISRAPQVDTGWVCVRLGLTLTPTLPFKSSTGVRCNQGVSQWP